MDGNETKYWDWTLTIYVQINHLDEFYYSPSNPHLYSEPLNLPKKSSPTVFQKKWPFFDFLKVIQTPNPRTYFSIWGPRGVVQGPWAPFKLAFLDPILRMNPDLLYSNGSSHYELSFPHTVKVRKLRSRKLENKEVIFEKNSIFGSHVLIFF